MKLTKNADHEFILLIGTTSGKIRIYKLPDNESKGLLLSHDSVVNFLTWDENLFMSAGSEGKIQVWAWKPASETTAGMAAIGQIPGMVGVMPSGIPGGMPGGMPGGIHGGMPSGITSGISGGMPGGMPGGISGGMSGGASSGISGGFSGGVQGIGGGMGI